APCPTGTGGANATARATGLPGWLIEGGYAPVPRAFYFEWAQRLGPMPSLVYFALCCHADSKLRCWPSLAKMASSLGISERTVRRSLRQLEEAGLVATSLSGDGHSPNRYELLSIRPDATPVPESGGTHSPPYPGHRVPPGGTHSPGNESHLTRLKERVNLLRRFARSWQSQHPSRRLRSLSFP